MLDRIAMICAFFGFFAALAISAGGGLGIFLTSPYLVLGGLFLLSLAAQFGLSKLPEVYDKLRRFSLPLGLFVSSLGLIIGILILVSGPKGGLSMKLILMFLATVIAFIIFLLAYLEARHEFVE